MRYLHENGVIIDKKDNQLLYVPGEVGHVEFPSEEIWKIHKANPGIIYELSHTHPPGMLELSGRDKLTLKTWTFALAPYIFRMSVISYSLDEHGFIRTSFRGDLEKKEHWIERGKGVRRFTIVKENVEYLAESYLEGYREKWKKRLIKDSYEWTN